MEMGPRACRKCSASFQPKPYQFKSGNYTCSKCQNAYQREYARKKYAENKLNTDHREGSVKVLDPNEVANTKQKLERAVQLPRFDLPGPAETERARSLLAKYGMELDEQALVAARMVKAGFPIKNLPGYLGRDYLLFCVMSDMMNVKHAQLRMKYLEMAGQLTGVISNGAPPPGGVNVMQVSFNELGIKPSNGSSLDGRKPSPMLEAETVAEEASVK